MSPVTEADRTRLSAQPLRPHKSLISDYARHPAMASDLVTITPVWAKKHQLILCHCVPHGRTY